MNDTPTPETDAAEMTASIIAVNLPPASARFVHAEFARKLESERDEERLSREIHARDWRRQCLQSDHLRRELAAERELADRLAECLESFSPFGEAPNNAIAKWKEARE